MVDAPDAFRGKYTGRHAAEEYANQVEDVLNKANDVERSCFEY